MRFLRELLGEFEERARRQHWDGERPWRVETHVGWDGPLPTIDLHDAGAGLSKQVMRAVLQEAERLQTGALCMVTGRGSHSLGPAVLRGLVRKEILRSGRARGWQLRPAGQSRPVRW